MGASLNTSRNQKHKSPPLNKSTSLAVTHSHWEQPHLKSDHHGDPMGDQWELLYPHCGFAAASNIAEFRDLEDPMTPIKL